MKSCGICNRKSPMLSNYLGAAASHQAVNATFDWLEQLLLNARQRESNNWRPSRHSRFEKGALGRPAADKAA